MQDVTSSGEALKQLQGTWLPSSDRGGLHLEYPLKGMNVCLFCELSDIFFITSPFMCVIQKQFVSSLTNLKVRKIKDEISKTR